MNHRLIIAFVCIAINFSSCSRSVPAYSVAIDMQRPMDYSGIPATVKWFPMGTYEFCAIQGAVTANFRLPDGRVIADKFHIVYIDRDSEGVFRVRGDSLNGAIPNNKAPDLLRAELVKWAGDLLTPIELEQQEGKVLRWIDSDVTRREMREGFFIKRSLYEISFSFFSTYLHRHTGLGYSYELKLREQKR